MPIYEYQCEKCGHQLEVLQSISDQPLCDCPACHEPSLNKLISSTNFQLKGTGWYVTDFRDKAKPANANSTDSNKSSNTSETAADTVKSPDKPIEKISNSTDSSSSSSSSSSSNSSDKNTGTSS